MGRSWIRTLHAVTALLLMVLFFAAAALAAAALVYVGGHVAVGAFSLRGKAIIFAVLFGAGMVVAGLVIAWSLLPRFDRFEPPGPELERTAHPALFKEIDRVAAMTGEQGPESVYLLGEVNAFVSERGGLAGVGTRRVMGLGLPLLNALTVSELRAVLAHEFGHFAGGDTSLGQWVHKTRMALVRTLNNLGQTGNATSELGAFAVVFTVVHAPFRWFFAFYMRFTQALSRRQEFDADALAAQLEGTRALCDGLVKVERAALGYSLFVRSELSPLVSQGFLPPVGHGFRQFLGAKRVSEQLQAAIDTSLAEGEADPYDSHPPLKERVAAAQKLARPARAADERLAVELLRDVDALELTLARDWVDEGKPLKAIGWEQAGAPLEALWLRSFGTVAPKLGGLTLRAFRPEVKVLRALCEREHGAQAVANSSDDDVRSWGRGTAQDALLVALVTLGYRALNRPGEVVALRRGEEEVSPLEALHRFFQGELPQADWEAQLEALGVAEIDLATLASTTSA